MRTAARLFAALALSLAAAPLAAQGAPPDGYPPKLGVIEGRLGSEPAAWETFDFSVGAFDASAWIDSHDGLRLTLVGYPPGDPDAESGKLRLEVSLPAAPQPDMLADGAAVLVQIFDTGHDGARLSSQGRPAQVMIDAVAWDNGPGSGYGSIRGRFSAEMCPRGGKTGRCRRLEGRFDTRMQYSGIDPLPAR